MALSNDHNAISQAVAGWRQSHNPDGLGQHDGPLDLPADLWQAMLAGRISPLQARQEWAQREPQQRAFNAEIRARAGLGYVADASDALDPDGRPAIRDASTGQFADLDEAARAATGVDVPAGGIIPTERLVAAPDPNQALRDAYFAAVARRNA